MGDLVNLKLARKRKARVQARDQAAENRALHGRTKATRKTLDIEKAAASLKLDGHKRDRP